MLPPSCLLAAPFLPPAHLLLCPSRLFLSPPAACRAAFFISSVFFCPLTSSYPCLPVSPALCISAGFWWHLLVPLTLGWNLGWSRPRTFLQVLRRHSSEPCRGRSATPHAGCFGEASGKWGGGGLPAGPSGCLAWIPPQAPKASSANRRESTLGWSSERLPMCLSKCLSVLLLELQADVLIGGAEPLLGGYWRVVMPSFDAAFWVP